MEVTALRRSIAMINAMGEVHTTRPREVLDISDAHRMAAEATKIVERIEKIRAKGAVSKEDFARVVVEMGRGVETALSPSKVRQALRQVGMDADAAEEVQIIELADIFRNALADLWLSLRVV